MPFKQPRGSLESGQLKVSSIEGRCVHCGELYRVGERTVVTSGGIGLGVTETGGWHHACWNNTHERRV